MAWKLLRLKIDNFGLIANERITLLKKGLVYVGGDNRDTPKANSNGAGKTTLLRSLTWLLYETDLSGATLASEVVKQGSKTCTVSGTFLSDDRTMMTITRTRTRTTGSIVRIERGKSPTQEGRSEELKAAIESMFGPCQLFLAAHIFSLEEGTVPFALESDKTQKRLFDLLVDASDLDRALMKATEKSKALKAHITDQESMCLILERDVQRYTEELDKASAHLAEAVKTTDAELAKAVKEEALWRKRVNRLKEDYDTLVNKYHESTELVESTRRERDRLVLSFETDSAKLKALRGRVERALDELEGAQKSDGTCQCPTCATKLSTNKYESVVRSLEKELRECDRLLAEREVQHVADVAALRMDEVKQSAKDCRDESRLAAEQLDKAKDTLREKTRRVSELQSVHKAMKTANARSIESLEVNLKQAQSDLYSARQRLEQALLDYEDTQMLCEAFGPKGIRAYRLDKITPLLNGYAEAYSSVLFGDGTRVVYSTQKRNKDGTLREAFNVSVVDGNGTAYTTVSAGQAMRRDIVHTFSMVELARAMGKHTLSMLVFDECFRSLDEAGIESVMDLLKQWERNVSTILVIEHNDDLKSRFDTALIATRKGSSTTFVWE